jgi:hypothetical protein
MTSYVHSLNCLIAVSNGKSVTVDITDNVTVTVLVIFHFTINYAETLGLLVVC